MLEPSKINPREKPQLTLEQAIVEVLDNPYRTNENCQDLVREMDNEMEPRTHTFFWEKLTFGDYQLARKTYIFNTDITMYNVSLVEDGEQVASYEIHIERNPTLNRIVAKYDNTPLPNERLLELNRA